MALPLNEFADTPVPAAFLAPDDRTRSSLLVDYEMGGIALGDPSQGLRVQVWEARVSGNDIQVKPELSAFWTTVITVADVTEIAFAFDQNMRPVVSYVAAGVAKMYWFDTVAASFVTTTLVGASSPVVTMDDKRPNQVSASDVLLFYIAGGEVKYRQQRDRFTIERTLDTVPVGMTRITRWGMSVVLRMQLEFGADDLPAGPVGSAHSAAYTDLVTDALYVVSGDQVIPMFETGLRTGRWRTPLILQPAHPAFAWLRLNGPLSAAVTVRIYANGVLWHTATLSDRAPVRLPPGRFRHLEVEVESQSRVSSVVLSTTSAELVLVMAEED